MIDYLNQDDTAIRTSIEKGTLAITELLKRALALSCSFRLEFDGARLDAVIGKERMKKLVPKYISGEGKRAAHRYDVESGNIDDENAQLLTLVLSPTVPAGMSERPLNYIQSVRLLDKVGATIFRGGDHNDAILFRLPDSARAGLLNEYRKHGIPEKVIEQVDVDVESLEP